MLAQEQLQLDQEGIEALRTRLRAAGGDDPVFDARFDRLVDVLRTISGRLQSEFGDEIERVVAIGNWALDGIDLRTLPYDDIIIQIVVRSAERPFDLYCRIAEKVFDNLRDEDIFVQFDLETLPEWHRAQELAHAGGHEETLGVPLLILT